MKLSKLFFLLLLITSSVFSQNKQKTKKIAKEPSIEETQKWIKSVIDIYGTGNLKFENEKIYYYIPSYPATNRIYNQEVFLRNLNQASSSKGNGAVWIHIDCLNGKSVYVDCKAFNFNTANLNITLKENITDEMIDRLIKAFNHLAKLSNGNKIGNTF